MTMYNLLHGQNADSETILKALGLTKESVGRFRDCWVERIPTGGYRVAVYTRNGGGNRDCWSDDSASCGTCPGCIIEHVLPKHPLYIGDSDDDFDSTYATIYFNLPESKESLAFIAQSLPEPLNMDEVWAATIEAIKGARIS